MVPGLVPGTVRYDHRKERMMDNLPTDPGTTLVWSFTDGADSFVATGTMDGAPGNRDGFAHFVEMMRLAGEDYPVTVYYCHEGKLVEVPWKVEGANEFDEDDWATALVRVGKLTGSFRVDGRA
jgi:hypothetical protein